MNKAEKERRERRQRMLAREQGRPSAAPVPGTSDDVGLRTPQPVRRSRQPAASDTEAGAGDAARAQSNLRSLTPLLKQRQHRRNMAVGVAVLVIALVIALLTGAMSASIALLADSMDSFSLYLQRGNAGWPVDTGISEPLQVEELAGGFVELGAEDVVVYSAYGSRVRAFQPGYARPVLAVGGTRFAVYNRAGGELRVCSRTRDLFTRTFEEGILLCAMSANNTLAVVTESGSYTAQLQIFDPSFRQRYRWQLTQNEGTPIAVGFAPDNRRFAAGTLAARDGQLACSVYFMDTAEETLGPVYTATQGSMLLQLDWQSDDRVVAVFDTYIAVLDPRTAAETARYDFGGATLQSAAPGVRQTALLLNIRGGNSLVTFDEDLTPLAEIPARQAFGVTATETEVYLLCPNAVECYRYDGVQKWARQDLSGHPLAVLDAAQTLVFTGTTAEVLAPPEGAA